MRKFTFLILFSILGMATAFAQSWPANGGPDAYGYTYETFDNASPNYDWVDISTKGEELFGLSDDNFIGPIDLGIDFDYYWIRRNQMWIGSNGYVSFGRGFNISSTANGFPITPTPDNNNELLAPFMCDLSFGGAGNPGRMFVWTNNVDSFVVSYVNVPFWTNNAAGYAGANSFQIVLNAADSTIKYQYLSQVGNWNSSYDLVPNPMVTGIENVTGNIGLLVSNTIKPTSQTGVVFKAPTTALIDIYDAAPVSVQNPSTEGFFLPVPGAFKLNATVGNVGNVTLDSTTDIRLQATDTLGQTRYDATQTAQSLPSGAVDQITFPAPFNPPPPFGGAPYTPYLLTATTFNNEDFNPTNNTRIVEAVAVDTSGGEATFGFVSDNLNNIDGLISWTGGAGNSGAGVFIEPYGYPVTIDSLQVQLLFNVGALSDSPSFVFDVYGANPLGSGPGPLLYSDTINPSQVNQFGGWTTVGIPVADRPTVTADGFFVGWIQLDTALFLATETAQPISRRSYEILDGTWADYRRESEEDIWLRAKCTVADAIVCRLAANGMVVAADTNDMSTGQAAAIVDSTSGDAPFTFSWNDPGNQNTQVASGLRSGNYTCTITDANNCTQTVTVTIQGVINTTGIQDDLSDLEVFEVYPNPTEGQFTLNLELSQNNEISVKVFDLQGRKVFLDFAKGVRYNENINLDTQAPGVYIIQVTTSQGQATKKVVLK